MGIGAGALKRREERLAVKNVDTPTSTASNVESVGTLNIESIVNNVLTVLNFKGYNVAKTVAELTDEKSLQDFVNASEQYGNYIDTLDDTSKETKEVFDNTGVNVQELLQQFNIIIQQFFN